MNAKSQARLSVSTWSLHRSLGKPPFYGPTSEKGQLANPTAEHAFSLLELPVQIAARGINTLEICHFHMPSDAPEYYLQLRAAIDAVGVAACRHFSDLAQDQGRHGANRSTRNHDRHAGDS